MGIATRYVANVPGTDGFFVNFFDLLRRRMTWPTCIASR